MTQHESLRPSARVTVRGVTFANGGGSNFNNGGNLSDSGGAILNQGTLTLQLCTVQGSRAVRGDGSGVGAR